MFASLSRLPVWERVYCWVLIVLGFAGGSVATYTALKNILVADFQVPCYVQDSANQTISAMGGH